MHLTRSVSPRRLAGVLLLLFALLPAFPQQWENLQRSRPRVLGAWETTDAIFAAAFHLEQGSEKLREVLDHRGPDAGVLVFQSAQNRGNAAVAMAISRVAWPRPVIARVAGADEPADASPQVIPETVLFHGLQPPTGLQTKVTELAPGLLITEAVPAAE